MSFQTLRLHESGATPGSEWTVKGEGLHSDLSTTVKRCTDVSLRVYVFSIGFTGCFSSMKTEGEKDDSSIVYDEAHLRESALQAVSQSYR